MFCQSAGRLPGPFRIGLTVFNTGEYRARPCCYPFTLQSLYFYYPYVLFTRDDGVFMGPPFLAYYGALNNNQSLLQLAYDNCRLYRNALLIDGPTGPLWGHIYDDDTKSWVDEGIWGTGGFIFLRLAVQTLTVGGLSY